MRPGRGPASRATDDKLTDSPAPGELLPRPTHLSAPAARRLKNRGSMHLLTTVTVSRSCLVDVLDALAEAAAAIEDQADGHPPLRDAEDLIRDLRDLVAELSLEVAASDLLL